MISSATPRRVANRRAGSAWLPAPTSVSGARRLAATRTASSTPFTGSSRPTRSSRGGRPGGARLPVPGHDLGDAQRDHPHQARRALADDDGGGLGAAGVDPGKAGERSGLPLRERGREPLVDVLGRVGDRRDVGGAEHLVDERGERVGVQVDEVRSRPLDEGSQGSRVRHGPAVDVPGASRGHLVDREVLGPEDPLGGGVRPGLGHDERHLDAGRDERPVAGPLRRLTPRVGDPQHVHATILAGWAWGRSASCRSNRGTRSGGATSTSPRSSSGRGLADRVVFVDPPVWGRPPSPWSPEAGITVLTPRLRAPKRLGGLRLLAASLHRGPLSGVDVLWVNDPRLGSACLRRGRPATYDVTDDWRTAPSLASRRAQLIAAEDVLARHASTVACSPTLVERWQERYGLTPVLIPNGLDLEAWASAVPRRLAGPGPHATYVGTLHRDRLDLALVRALAARPGTVHLVGPDALEDDERVALVAAGTRLEGAVPAAEVPGWMLGSDVLISPHLVTAFTLSLDAIKAREYAVSGRPVVATPTSGFEPSSGAVVVAAAGFPAAVDRAVATSSTVARDGSAAARTPDVSWAARARLFAAALAQTEA